ncbi:MAG: glycosyltransferase [Bacilli bacterium]|nr:glycosyltransferase [Bacilli bacterium]
MKVLVQFEPNNLDYFDGTRMRKTIKGGLELMDVQHTSTIMDTYDIAHFISPDDEAKIHYALETRTPIVVSALYTEDDENARFLEHKIRADGKRKTYLKPKALKMLNNANVVLVPTESSRDMLINFGVTTEIKVCPLGVNLARFNFSRIDEKEIFLRYFGENGNRKIVLAMSSLTTKKEGINTFINAATANPETNFYYIGSCEDSRLKKSLRRYIKKAPKNAHFIGALTDDLHRSALLNADLVLFPGYTPTGITSVYEAMAAKCQLVAREETVPNDLFINGENCYIGKFSETLVSLVSDYLSGKMQPTIENAFNQVSKCTLEKFGRNLVKIYKEQLSLKRK